MYVKHHIVKQKAGELLSKRKWNIFSRKKLIKCRMFYLPMWFFVITVTDKRNRKYTDKAAVEVIRGEFSLFREVDFTDLPADALTPEVKINCDSAAGIAKAEYSRLLFRNNLKTGADAEISNINEGMLIYYPYWTGFYQRNGAFDFEVIDAVDGSLQGPKMKPVFAGIILESANRMKNY